MTSWKLLMVCALAAPASAETVSKGSPTTPYDSRKPPSKPVKPDASKPAGYSGHGIESVSAADLARFAPPPLAPEVSRRIQAMLDVRGAGAGAITSKGDRMFFNSAITGQLQVWRQDGPMKFPIQITGGEDRTTLVSIAPDDSFLVITRDIAGQEYPGLYLQAPTGGPLEVIQHAPKVQTSHQFVSDDSKSIVFRANDIRPDSYALYRYDVASRKRELVFDQPGIWSVADQRGDKWLLVKALGNTQREIYEFEVSSKKLTPLLGQNESFYFDVAFGAKPGQLIVHTDKLGDFHRLYRYEAGKLAPISPDVKHDVDEFTIDHKRTRIYYSLNEHGYQRLAVLDAKTLRPVALPKLPAADNIGVANVSRNGRFVQLTIDSSTMPPTSATYDWQTRKLTTWRVPSTPEIDTRTFAKATLEHYPARDGTKIPMFVRRPAPSKCSGPCPVIVDFHGGPEGQSKAGFGAGAQLFVDAGFVFVEPNVRGSSGYGKTWLDSDNGPKRKQVITDIEDAARFIRASWGKDGKAPKIGILGGSYGGYATLMGMTYFAGAYDAGVQIVGISNMLTFLNNTAPYRRMLRIAEYGDPVKDRAALIELSPVTHIKKLKAPLLSIQGVNDPRVPAGEAIQFYKEAEARKIPGGLILFADEGHGSSKRSNKVLEIGHTLAFFEKHLK